MRGVLPSALNDLALSTELVCEQEIDLLLSPSRARFLFHFFSNSVAEMNIRIVVLYFYFPLGSSLCLGACMNFQLRHSFLIFFPSFDLYVKDLTG